MSYQAIVARLENVREHPNADRLKLADVRGVQLVVGLDATEGELGIFFPEDGQLTDEYCVANDLYPRFENGERVGGGFFDPNRRVRAKSFRGQRSTGYFTSIDSVSYTGVDLDLLVEGVTFDKLNDHDICNKYFSPKTLKAMAASGGRLRKSSIMFPPHVDSLRYQYSEDIIFQPGNIIYLTEKLHGTCLTGQTSVTMADGSKKKIKDVEIGDFVLGVNNQGEPVPSEVSDVIIGERTEDWIDTRVSPAGFLSDGRGYRIRSTPEHLFWSNSGYKEAKDLIVGDDVVISNFLIEPSQDQYSICHGLLLGDGWLSTNSEHSSGITFGHKRDHIEYSQYIVDSLGNLGGSGKQKERISGFGSDMVDFTTNYSRHFNELQDFYADTDDGRKRVVPEWLVDKFNPISLAIWYMDDGSLAVSEGQNDRANIASCSYDDESIEILVECLNKLGITNVTSYKTRGSSGRDHNRLRINWKGNGSDLLFEAIQPYVPPVMQYKLPEKFRNEHWQAPVFENGTLKPYLVNTKVLSTNETPPVSFFEKGDKKKYDITTETHNFFANNVLVHNSGRYACVKETVVTKKAKWYNKLFKNYGTEKTEDQWQEIVGSRNVVITDPETQGFYPSDQFRFDIFEGWRDQLIKGEVVYGEIVGWAGPGTAIMGTHDVTKMLPELKEVLGDIKDMRYSYGTIQGEAQFYCYRIAMVTEEGELTELPWSQVKRRCKELGIKYVPEVYKPILLPENVEDQMGLSIVENVKTVIDILSEGVSTLDPTHIREGLVVRVEGANGKTSFVKNKGYTFNVLEGIIKNNDDYVDFEEIS